MSPPTTNLNGNVRESPLSLEPSGLSSYLYLRQNPGRSFGIPYSGGSFGEAQVECPPHQFPYGGMRLWVAGSAFELPPKKLLPRSVTRCACGFLRRKTAGARSLFPHRARGRRPVAYSSAPGESGFLSQKEGRKTTQAPPRNRTA